VNSVITRTLKFDKTIKTMRGVNQPHQYYIPGQEDINNMPDEETRLWKEQRSLYKVDARGPLKKSFKKDPLGGRPQLRGIVLKTVIKKPKKPNSANRKCVLVRLSTGKEATCYVPGIGHNLQEHSNVLVRWHRVPDVPGLKLRVIRGVYDCSPVIKRTSEGR
jgi:small subunit ribosomal protein S12